MDALDRISWGTKKERTVFAQHLIIVDGAHIAHFGHVFVLEGFHVALTGEVNVLV